MPETENRAVFLGFVEGSVQKEHPSAENRKNSPKRKRAEGGVLISDFHKKIFHPTESDRFRREYGVE